MLSRTWLPRRVRARPVPLTPRQAPLLVAAARARATSKGRTKAKAPTNGTQMDPPRSTVRLHRRPVNSRCLLLAPLRQSARGMPKCSQSLVRHTTARRASSSRCHLASSGVFDVGKFCAANGVAFNDCCWEFVCSQWMSTFYRANKAFYAGNAQRAVQALRLACARCPHSSDTSNHPEALAAKHKFPPHLGKMMAHFRQG